MPIIDLQGEADGLATVSSDTAYAWPLYFAGSTNGYSALDGWLQCTLWASGVAYGYGDLTHPEPILVGEASGATTCNGTLLVTYNMLGATYGKAHVYDSLPLPITCRATLEGELELDPVPVQHEYKKLYLGQMLQKGDLEIQIKALNNTPLSPYAIDYTLYQVTLPYGQVQVGGANIAPAQGGMGYYYATGYLDGQPGKWLIVWHYQMEFGGTVSEYVEEFEVEEVRVRCEDRAPWNPNWERCQKKGWD